MPELTKAQISKALKNHAIRFSPKYRAFSILQNNIEDIVKKPTHIWKLIYGLTTVREGEPKTIEVKDDEEDGEKDNTIVGGTKMQGDDKETSEPEKLEEQNVQDTQFLSVSPPHVTTETTKIVTIKDISNLSTNNIDPITKDNLKKILEQSTLQAKLCDNPILISVDELQNSMTDVARKKVNPQEPPPIIPLVINVQNLIQIPKDTSTKVDTIAKIDTDEKKTIEEQAPTIGQ